MYKNSSNLKRPYLLPHRKETISDSLDSLPYHQAAKEANNPGIAVALSLGTFIIVIIGLTLFYLHIEILFIFLPISILVWAIIVALIYSFARKK